MVIDFHVHCFADGLAERAVASLAEKANLPPKSDGTVKGIRESMKRAGVDISVLQSIATKPQHTPVITQWALSVRDNGIIPFGSIHPDCLQWEEELEQLYRSGIKGIKFHPEYQEFYVDDPKMFPIYQKAAELGLVMIFHAGRDLGFEPPYHCVPDRMRNVVKEFPHAKIVAAHMGGFDYWDEVEKYLVGEPIYFDTSFSLREMGREQFMRIGDRHGFDKLLFATDSPWGEQSEELDRLRRLALPDDVLNAVLGGNAAKLLGLTC